MPLIVDALHALQHRGQEAAGAAVSDGTDIKVVKDVGLVTDVLHANTVAGLSGSMGIGHTRYSTTGGSIWENAQPCYRSSRNLNFALGHNGNLTNTLRLAAYLGGIDSAQRSGLCASNDSDLIAALIARALEAGALSLESALIQILPELEGAFSLVVMDHETLVGVRDPNGFRPLCLGRISGGWTLASETAALDVIGAEFIREILPGEMVVITPGQAPRSAVPFSRERINPSLCSWEFVYMARPDSELYGVEVNAARLRMGELLARKAPVTADMVMGVPDSAMPAAEGYASASGIPFGSGLVRNRYIGRTFIHPSQNERERSARRKFNVLRERVHGKRLIVVEDSVVRGTTTRLLSRMLRDAGAVEVHLRVALPPVKWPCYYGIDIGNPDELLGASHSVSEIRELLKVDSLAFLDIGELHQAIRAPEGGLCDACLTNNYPTKLEQSSDKFALEV